MRLVSYLHNSCATVPKSGQSRDSEPRIYPQWEGGELEERKEGWSRQYDPMVWGN